MYKILAGDAKEYGPVSVETLRQWVREGRANGSTQVRDENSPAWAPLSTVAELSDVLNLPPPVLRPATAPVANRAGNKVIAGICGILLGTWGVHKFILGYTGAGFVTLGISLALLVAGIATCGLTLPLLGIVHIIGLIEGIIYLAKSDEEFVRIYVDGRKEWF